MRALIFLRDIVISTAFIFLGLFYFAKSWGEIGIVWGLFFLAIGILCYLKLAAFPFSNISPTTLSKVYLSFQSTDQVEQKKKLGAFGRAFLILILLPIVLFIPVSFMLSQNFKMNGFTAGTLILMTTGLFLGIKYITLKLRDNRQA